MNVICLKPCNTVDWVVLGDRW